MYDLLIKDGLVVSPVSTLSVDVAIKDGKIAALGEFNSLSSHETISARGKLVLPGMIDPHVHLWDNDPSLELNAADNHFTGTVAAAFGGNTTVLDFAYPVKSGSVTEAVTARRTDADDNVAVDYSLHVVVDSDSTKTIETIRELPKHGINSIKAFMTRGSMAEDYSLLRIMCAAAESNLLMLVHPENASLVRGNRHSMIEDGRLSITEFPNSQPVFAEIEATQRAILLAEYAGVVLYVVHISSGRVADIVREAQRRGLRVIGETVTHYLTLTEEVYARGDGANFVCGPPLRTKTDQIGLWDALCDGTITTLGSDHCGFDAAQKALGKGDWHRTPKGIAGIETRISVIFSEGVIKGRLTLPQFVGLCAANPAQTFGLYPRKGVIAPGSDADICIFDPTVEWTITPNSLHFDWGWSPHDGLSVTGKPRTTILRGKVIVVGDEYRGSPGDGQFIHRNSPCARDHTYA
ncbi:MAG: dihydropyrimidinase [Anaerolineae bacterium]|nr:dihydropyrimidinase [Anaerolineae bacterium]